MTKKKPKFGALPTLNMPERSHTIKAIPRPSRSVVNESSIIKPVSKPNKYYKSFPTMRVNRAAQVLSATVAAVLKTFGPSDAAATSQLCEMVDSYFDCLNVRSTTEHMRRRKPLLAPYTSVNDPRFIWLENDSLGYLRDWKESTANFFSKCPRQNVLILANLRRRIADNSTFSCRSNKVSPE
jgi:hypothetical protein